MNSRTVLITGASAGIGESFAEVFAANGFDLVLTARREDRLRAVAARLEQSHRIRAHVMVSDHSLRETPARLCAEIATRGLTIDGLVNNAGYAIPGSLVSSSWERHEAMLQVMVTGLTELTYRLLPGMIDRGYGRIINVASLAGLVPAPGGQTLYAASKAFAIKFSEALSHEVTRYGVHVTAVCPGFTRSGFHDVMGTRDRVNKMPTWMWMDSPTVAKQGFDAVMAGIPIYVNGRLNRAIVRVVRYLPQGLIGAVARRLASAYRGR